MTSLARLPTRAIGMLKNSAVFGLMYATLSQVTFDSGFGSSCSHPLFEKRPSQTVGSGLKISSKLLALAKLVRGTKREQAP